MPADEPRLVRVFGPQSGRRTFGQSVWRVLSLLVLVGVVAAVGEALGLPRWAEILVALPVGFVILPFD